MEVWSEYVRRFFESKLVGAKHFQDFSDDVTGGGESITIPHIAEGPTPTSLTTTTGALTDNVISDTRTQLTINSWIGLSQRFTDYQVAQIAAKYNLEEHYARMHAYGLSKTFDTCLLQTAQNNLQRRVNDSSSSINATDLRAAMLIFDSYSIPREDALLILAPDHYWDLMRNNLIYDASVFGRGAPMAEGVHDYIFGIPTVVTANVPSYGVSSKADLLVHKRTVAFAIGNINGMSKAGPRIQFKDSSESLASRLITDLMFGVKILDGYGGVKIVGRYGA